MTRLLLLIPGNPGDAIYYAAFVQQLRARGHEVIVSGHPIGREAPGDLLSLARYHAETARRHLAASGRSLDEVEVVVLGHSLGAYLAHLVVAHDLLPVGRVFMLFPFLMRPTLSGRLILRAACWPLVFRCALGLFRALPRRVQHWLAVRGGCGDLVPEILTLLASSASASALDRPLAVLALARIEQREIAAHHDATYLFKHPLFAGRERFVVVLCAGDRWAPSSLARQLTAFAYHCPPPITHAFVADPAQRQAVADLLHQFLTGADPRGIPQAVDVRGPDPTIRVHGPDGG